MVERVVLKVNVPEIWAKERVKDATAKPAASAIPMAGGVCPDQGTKEPHTMKMRKKEAKHSATIARQKSRLRISACIGTRSGRPPFALFCSVRMVSKRSISVVKRLSTPAFVNGVTTLNVVVILEN